MTPDVDFDFRSPKKRPQSAMPFSRELQAKLEKPQVFRELGPEKLAKVAHDEFEVLNDCIWKMAEDQQKNRVREKKMTRELKTKSTEMAILRKDLLVRQQPLPDRPDAVWHIKQMGAVKKRNVGFLRRGGKMPPETFQKLLKNFQKTSEKLSKKLLKNFQKNFGKILQNQFPLLHKRKMKLF